MAKEGKQCSPVNPNYGPGDLESEKYLGASSPGDHPLSRSTVDPNYSSSGGGGKPASTPAIKPLADDAGTMQKDEEY